MRVLSMRRLREFWERHPDAEVALRAWWKTTIRADWKSLRDVRVTYSHADGVRLANGLTVTVFNIRGGHYRLITTIHYKYQRVYIKFILAHREYDSGRWKDLICPP